MSDLYAGPNPKRRCVSCVARCSRAFSRRDTSAHPALSRNTGRGGRGTQPLEGVHWLWRMRAMTERLGWLFAVMGLMIGCAHSGPARPAIVKLGTIDCDMVET